MDAILHLRQAFPLIPIIFVVNKIDIDIEAVGHDIGDISDEEERQIEMEESTREQNRLIHNRVTAIFEKLKKPCPGSGLTFLPEGAEFGRCDYFHTVSSKGFRRARLAKDAGPNESEHIDSFLRFEESFVHVLNQNLETMDEKLVTCITVYLQGMSSLMGRARHGIREALETLPLLTKVAIESELQMRNMLNKFIDTSLGDKKLFEKAVKTKEFKDLLSFQWSQIQEADSDMIRFMCCGSNCMSLVGLFDIDEYDLEVDIAPAGSSLEKNVQRMWYVTEARNLAVAKLSEQVDTYVVAKSNSEIDDLLKLLFECQKALKEPYLKLLLQRAYCTHTMTPSNRRGGSFSTMVISTAAYGMYNSINKGIVAGIGEEMKKLYQSSDLKKLLPNSLSVSIGGRRWHEKFADNLIAYLSRNSRRISKLICEHASKELDIMHVVFVMHIRRLEGLADDFKAQGKEELVEIGNQFRPRINLLTLRAHALRCQFSRGSILLGERLRVGNTCSVYRCSDDKCGWCFDHVDGMYHRSVVARVVPLDMMTEEKRARFVRDLVYTM
jgi:hypothetical protein